MSSKKKAKAKKKKAAEMARKNAAVHNPNVKTEKLPQEKKVEEPVSKVIVTEGKNEEEAAIKIKEIVEKSSAVAEEKKEENATGKTEHSTQTGVEKVSSKRGFAELKEKFGVGLYIPVAVCMVLLIAVVILALRLGGVTKELKAVQTMSAGYQQELEGVKQDLDEVELELMSKEPEKVYIEVYPTATPEPTPKATVTPEPIKYVVCVDPGHGDWDGGACLVDEDYRYTRKECDDNLWISKLFRDALLEYEDVEVIMTRETDVYLDLPTRTDIANEAEADAIISFHRNSYNGDGDVKGVEFWIHSSRPKLAQSLAGGMLDAIMKVGGMNNRGIKYGSTSSTKEDYSINRRASMTSMIVELGFITSEEDNAAYDANGEAYAKEMAKVVYDWLVELKKK